MGKFKAVISQAIDMRRFYAHSAIAAHISVAEVIGQDHDNIGRGCSIPCHRQGKQHSEINTNPVQRVNVEEPLSAPVLPPSRGIYILDTIALPNSEQLSNVASSIRRSKS